MDIDIFDQLYEIAKEDSNEERLLLKSFQRKDSYAELAITEQSFKKYSNFGSVRFNSQSLWFKL